MEIKNIVFFNQKVQYFGWHCRFYNCKMWFPVKSRLAWLQIRRATPNLRLKLNIFSKLKFYYYLSAILNNQLDEKIPDSKSLLIEVIIITEFKWNSNIVLLGYAFSNSILININDRYESVAVWFNYCSCSRSGFRSIPKEVISRFPSTTNSLLTKRLFKINSLQTLFQHRNYAM